MGQVIFAQGEKSLKMASKKFAEFTADPFTKSASLEEAKTFLKEAFEDGAVAADPKAWLTRGEIFFNSGDAQVKNKLLYPDNPFVDPNSAIEAFKAYSKAIELAEKKGDIKNALKGLTSTENLLNTMGVELYKEENFLGSFENFATELEAREILKAQGEPSRMDEGELYNEKLYFTGLTGYYAEEYEAAIDNLLKAKDTGTNEASLYQILFEAHKALDKSEEGLKYLEIGRNVFPDDSGLLFSEINYYLASGELDKMIAKLELALEKEPDNQSVILTLGQVYDQLQVKSNEAGESEKANQYFDKALGYYVAALKQDPENFDLNYSIGALYYNKAAGFTPMLNEVANDFSKEGEKKYAEIKENMNQYFDKALPYFEKADSLDGNDRNTLIALKEIAARKDNFEKSNAYKARLDALQGN